MTDKIRIGVSGCLLGKKTRFDGRDSFDAYVAEELSRIAEFLPICPEVEAGLAVPREPIVLEGDPAAPRMIGASTGEDYTDVLRDYALRVMEKLRGENIRGFVFKSKSPSCGVRSITVYDDEGKPAKNGVGLFAGILMKTFPDIPVEDNDSLKDPAVREKFVERIRR